VFFNMTFFPMHIIGVGGQMRRIYNPLQYEFLQHQQHWNVIITIGAIGLGLSQIPFAINFVMSIFAGRKAAMNPWNANTLEWQAPSPPPHLNWGDKLPTVYRGPYEYSDPDAKDDFLPQTQPPLQGAGARRRH
jgi:cytochrome c oxidase subunit 1